MLWAPNTIVFVNAPKLMHLVQDMLIERCRVRPRRVWRTRGSNASGTTAKLSLVDPRAYRGDASPEGI